MDTGDTGDTGDNPELRDTGEPSGETGVSIPESSWGEIEGDCGVLDSEEWSSPIPHRFRNTIDFGEQIFDPELLSDDGLRIYEAGNLGGSSLHSEVLAFEILMRCEVAELLGTEGEIDYEDSDGKKIDLLVEMDGNVVGVSVTRAFHWPPEEPFTVDEGVVLLEDKLVDVLASADNAASDDSWVRSLLHVIAYDTTAADAIETAHEMLDEDVRDSTVLFVTVTEGDDEIVY